MFKHTTQNPSEATHEATRNWVRKNLLEASERCQAIRRTLASVRVPDSHSTALANVLLESLARDLTLAPPPKEPEFIRWEHSDKNEYSIWIGAVFCGYVETVPEAQVRVEAMRAAVSAKYQESRESESRTALEDCRKEVGKCFSKEPPEDLLQKGAGQEPERVHYAKDRL